VLEAGSESTCRAAQDHHACLSGLWSKLSLSAQDTLSCSGRAQYDFLK
jgi:hypothetical protein